MDTPADDRAVVALPGEASSVGVARAFVRDTLEAWGLSRLADTVLLLTSELATNAVVHARTSYDVLVERTGDALRVSVLDDSPQQAVRRAQDLAASNGRGVALVHSLAPRWGSAPPPPLLGRTKGIWFELPTNGVPPMPTEAALDGTAWLDDVAL